MRIDETRAATYRWLATNLNAHCDTFIGLPVFYILYFWADKPAPSLLSNDRWFMTFDETQQQSMLATFREHSRTCAIRDHREFKKWLEMNPGRQTTGPLIDYIAREFVSLGSVQGWKVMVERSRNPLELTYSARIQPSLGKAVLPVRNGEIELTLPAIADARIARLVLFDTVRRSVLADTRPKPGTGTIRVRSVDRVP